jgi:hypothetical protein
MRIDREYLARRGIMSVVVASRRAWAVAAMFLVAAVLVIGSSVAAVPSVQVPALVASTSHPHPPSCAQSANCAGGALSGGSAFVVYSDSGTGSGLERVPTLSSRVVSDSGHIPSGVLTPLFHPPKGSSI